MDNTNRSHSSTGESREAAETPVSAKKQRRVRTKETQFRLISALIDSQRIENPVPTTPVIPKSGDVDTTVAYALRILRR